MNKNVNNLLEDVVTIKAGLVSIQKKIRTIVLDFKVDCDNLKDADVDLIKNVNSIRADYYTTFIDKIAKIAESFEDVANTFNGLSLCEDAIDLIKRDKSDNDE